MSEQSNPNPTTTVQVNEVGLPEQASIGKVLLIAGAAAGGVAALVSLLTEKEEKPATRTESAREYLRSALDEAQKKDVARATRKQRKKAEKSLSKQRKKASKDADRLMKQGKEVGANSAAAVRNEVSSLMDSIRKGNMDVDRVVEGFAESQLMAKLREFGEEAKVMAEQGKMRGEDVAHRLQDEVIPQAKKAAEEAAHRVQDDVIPEAKKRAEKARKAGKDKFEEVSEKTRKEFIPEAQKHTAEFADQARHTVEHIGEDAEKFLSEASKKAEKKRKEATKSVQRGGRETRSLLLWVSLAGILIFTVFLDEEQQQKLKEIAMEVFGEARDMYSDMKGDTSA